MDAPHLPSASGGGLAAPSPSPVSRVGAAAPPRSALLATRPGGTEPSRHSPPLFPPTLRPAFPRGTATPTPSPQPSSLPAEPRRQQQQQQQPEEEPEAAVAGEPMAYSQGGGKKKVCYYYDGERPAGGWVGGKGCGAGPGAASGSAAAVASGRRC